MIFGEVKPKVEVASNNFQRRKKQNYSKSPSLATPTAGLEKVNFDYEPGMKPGEFKYTLVQLAEFMEKNLKKYGPTTANAIKSGTKTTFQYAYDLKKFPTHQDFKILDLSFDRAATK